MVPKSVQVRDLHDVGGPLVANSVVNHVIHFSNFCPRCDLIYTSTMTNLLSYYALTDNPVFQRSAISYTPMNVQETGSAGTVILIPHIRAGNLVSDSWSSTLAILKVAAIPDNPRAWKQGGLTEPLSHVHDKHSSRASHSRVNRSELLISCRVAQRGRVTDVRVADACAS
jgi:hypothetical protein